MTSEPLTFKTRVTGNINGGAFECHGEGEWRDGGSTSQLYFDRPLVRFNPMYGKSWKCNNHKVAALMEPENPLSTYLNKGGRILTRTIIDFPYENSIILATSTSVPTLIE